MLLALFLFLNGVAAQTTSPVSTETTNHKLDRLLRYVQEKQHTSEFASKIANSDSDKFQRIIKSIEAGGQIILDKLAT